MTRRRSPSFTVENIADDLHPLAVPIDWITVLPGNPRRGRIEQIAKSYTRFGQRKPIVVNKTGEVDGHPVGYSEAGNHQLQAARDELGWSYIAVVWVEDDEATAKAFSLADNKLHDLGDYDTPLLAEFVADIAITDGGVDALADAGFSGDEMTRLIEFSLRQGDADPTGPTASIGGSDQGYGPDALPGPSVGLGTPVISTSIVFDTEEQQQAWYRFVRHLRAAYPDVDTTGERIALYVADALPDGAT